MTEKEINNFIINIKASVIINAFLYDYLDEHGKLDDIKEELDEDDYDDIHIVGYSFENKIILLKYLLFILVNVQILV